MKLTMGIHMNPHHVGEMIRKRVIHEALIN